MDNRLAQAIIDESKRRGADPLDFATLVGFETGGTFDVWQKGPRTKWGQHVGLIQMGEPQRKQFGYAPGISPEAAVKSSFDYLEAHGWKSGMSLLDMYSTINAGAPGKYGAMDGGTSVRQKVESSGMAAQRRKAAKLLNMEFTPVSSQPVAYPDYDTFNSAPSQRTFAERPTYTNDQNYNQSPLWTPENGINLSAVGQVAWDAAAGTTTAKMFSGGTDSQPDPNFALGYDRMEKDLKDRGLDYDRYADSFGEAHSEQHYQELLATAQADQDRLKRLEGAGLTGTLLNVGAQMLDPVTVATDIAVSSMVPGYVLAKRGGILGRALASGLAGAAGGTASTTVQAAYNDDVTGSDIFAGAVFGFGVGGAIGALRRNPATIAESARLQKAAQRGADEFAGVTQAGSTGAAKVRVEEPFLNDGALELLGVDDFDKTAFSEGRFDISNAVQTSPNPVTRVAAGLVRDGVGKKGGAINSIAVTEEQELYFLRKNQSFMRTYTPQLKEYIKETGTPWNRREEAAVAFDDSVYRYMLDTGADRADRYRPSVVKVGDKLAPLFKEALLDQQNPFRNEGLLGRAVKGTEGIKTNDNYVPRHWDADKIVKAIQEFGQDTVEELFARGFRSAHADWEEALVQRVAKGFTKAIINRAHGLDDMAHRVLGSDNVEALVKVLRDNGGMPEADAQAILRTFQKTADAGREGHNKMRVLLDENASISGPYRPREGVRGDKPLTLTDLMDTNVSSVYRRYMRNVSGRWALSRYRFKDPVTDDVLVNGFTSDGEWQQYLDKVVQKYGDLVKEGKLTREAAEAAKQDDIDRLNLIYNHIMGRPLHDGAEATRFGWWARNIRKFNFLRLMGQVGFAQISEIGMPIATLGVKAAFTQSPALRRIVTQKGETILRSGLADDLEVWLAAGTDRFSAHPAYRFDEMGHYLHDPKSKTLGSRVESFMDKSQRVVAEASGMAQITNMQQRWTAASIVQKFANMAQGSKGFSADRLADLGLDEKMTERVLKMFKEPGNFAYEPNWISGKKVVRANFDKWSDKEARTAFLNAAYRLSNIIIQKNDFGQFAKWMSKPAARMFLQFRTFTLGAWTNQTLKNLHMRDAVAVKQLVLTSGLAAAGYIVQRKIQAIGRGDQQDYEDRYLNWGEIGAAAFSRAGYSSILPMMLDTGRYVTGNDGWFSNTRTTGQVSDALWGNPTTGGYQDVLQALKAGAGLSRGDGWSQEEARSITRVLPFGNVLPLVMGLNPLIANLPEFAPREYDREKKQSIFGH